MQLRSLRIGLYIFSLMELAIAGAVGSMVFVVVLIKGVDIDPDTDRYLLLKKFSTLNYSDSINSYF